MRGRAEIRTQIFCQRHLSCLPSIPVWTPSPPQHFHCGGMGAPQDEALRFSPLVQEIAPSSFSTLLGRAQCERISPKSLGPKMSAIMDIYQRPALYQPLPHLTYSPFSCSISQVLQHRWRAAQAARPGDSTSVTYVTTLPSICSTAK